MTRSTSYPAIALLISLIIIMSGFCLTMFGINNFLEERRKYGIEVLTDFRNYNLFQFYTYVLSDYEVRRIFFKTVYEEILNKSITNGILNATLYNKNMLENPKIPQYVNRCDNIFEVIADKSITGLTTIIYFPCFELMPIEDFLTSFNKSFVEKLRQSYLENDIFRKHASVISNNFNFSIEIFGEEFHIDNSDIFFKQNLKYFYKGEKFTRKFTLEMNYSIIPDIVLYNKIFAREYLDFLEDLKKNLLENSQRVYNISQFLSYIDGATVINDGSRDIIVFYKNKNKTFNRLRIVGQIYNVSDVFKSSVYQKYQEIYLCEQITANASSVYILDYDDVYGCKIPKIPDPLKRGNYKYLIETCLYDQYYSIGEVDKVLAEICFYNFTNTILYSVDSLNKYPTEMANPFYGNLDDVSMKLSNIKNKYSEFYLWSVNELPAYVFKAIGTYKPMKCVLGYKYVEGPYIYSNLSDCKKKKDELIDKYGKNEDLSIFVSDCEPIEISLSERTLELYYVFVGKYSKMIYEQSSLNPTISCGGKEYEPIVLGVYMIYI